MRNTRAKAWNVVLKSMYIYTISLVKISYKEPAARSVYQRQCILGISNFTDTANPGNKHSVFITARAPGSTLT